MRVIRDILAIFGCISVGWCIWSWHRHTERAFSEGLVVAVIALFITIICIRSDQNGRRALESKLDHLDMENTYLRTAIKQMGGDPERQ